MEKFIEFFNIAGPGALILLGIWIVLNLIGETLDKTGKIVPAFMKVRTCIRKRKEAKQARDNLVVDVKNLLEDVNKHYSSDNITKRNEWMKWINSRTEVYDASVEDLKSLHKALEENNALTLDLYINFNRNRIIDFATQVLKNDRVFTREEFNRIFKVYKEYEEILEKYGKENGEVDVSIDLIRDDYARRMREGLFLEDNR